MKAEGEGLRHVEARTMHGARFRYFDFVMVAFVVVLLLSNVIGARPGVAVALMEWTVVHLPVGAGWTGQGAYERVFGSGWRIILASMSAFFVGEFLNSFVMAKMKIWSEGRNLWARFWGSTVVGEGADSLIFYPLAFYGMTDWPVSALGEVMLSQFVLKVGWEVLLTPATYAVVGWLKRKEGVDVYDVGTSFTPFTADL